MLEEGPQVNIHPEGLKPALKNIANWKTHGLDDIHEFWFKKFTSKHDRLATKRNKIIQKTEISEWTTKGETTLIQKDHLKGSAPNNYRPITYLRMMWKILMVQIREKIYYSLISCGIFPEEQKGCRRVTKDTVELLYIDEKILNESKTQRKNLAMAWIGYKKGLRNGPLKLDATLSQNV